MPGGAGGLGIGTVIVIGLISWYFGIDPSVLLNGAQILTGGGAPTQQTAPAPQVSARQRRPTRPAGSSRKYSATPRIAGPRCSPPAAGPIIRRSCGCSRVPSRPRAAFAKSAQGPFYCPLDKRIYLDTSFFDDMQHKFRACSDSNACKFAEAYVVAHEVGHHVQDELGILPQVRQAQQAAASKVEANQLQVRIELQADCLAGVWANHAQQKHKFLDPGDVDQALQTATAIGDDRLQKETQGYVVPDSFTHGTSEQRKRWFQAGFNGGQVNSCNTLSASSL